MVRGDVYRMKFPKGSGHEQRGPRFGVVLQSDAIPALSTVLVAPTSLSALPASYRPQVDVDGQATRVLVEHVKAVDRRVLGRRVGHLLHEEMWSVDEALGVVLGLG